MKLEHLVVAVQRTMWPFLVIEHPIPPDMWNIVDRSLYIPIENMIPWPSLGVDVNNKIDPAAYLFVGEQCNG